MECFSLLQFVSRHVFFILRKKRDPGIEAVSARNIRTKIFSFGLFLRSNIGYLLQNCKDQMAKIAKKKKKNK